MTTKAKLKADYIAALQSTCDFYIPGSRALELAIVAIDRALSGELNLQGACWFNTLRANGLRTAITRQELAGLPEK